MYDHLYVDLRLEFMYFSRWFGIRMWSVTVLTIFFIASSHSSVRGGSSYGSLCAAYTAVEPSHDVAEERFKTLNTVQLNYP